MNRTEKIQAIEDLRQVFSGAESVLLADTSGVNVNSINGLRSRFRAEGVTFRVVKNTLARIALEGTGLEALAPSFVGPTAIVVKHGDPVSPAKIAVEFAKTNPKFDLKGGFISGTVLDAEGVVQLSKMKGLNELRAELLSVFKAPQTNFVGVCSTMVTQFLGLLNARADKLEEAA